MRSAALMLLIAAAGCGPLRYRNETPILTEHIRASQDATWVVMVKAAVLVPARDLLTLDPLWRAAFGCPAWNADGAGVADSSFYTNRRPDELTPARVALGACTDPPPEPPFTITRLKTSGATTGFVGTDARGRKYLFKLDHPDYPELGTSAEVIGSRILWALGYHVPPVYLVRVAGTGDARFDGRRATATLYLDGVQGHFHFDWFRQRRELRGLRLASAWLNDTDRVGTNTLVVVRDGRMIGYLIDFNSCLGAWQGRPKEPWRGWRHEWDVGWFLARLATCGLAHPERRPHEPIVSPAVGRFGVDHFDPLAWRAQVPNNAFEHLTGADLRWIVERIARLERSHIAAIVAAAELSDPRDADRLVHTLLGRRERIMTLLPQADERPNRPVRR